MKTAWFTALFFLIGMTTQAWGFWSFVSIGSRTFFDDHADITNQAIGPTASFMYGTSPTQYTFSNEAIRAITIANEQTDEESHEPYDSADHFDSQDFAGGVYLIITRRGELKKLLTQPVTSKSQQKAWTLLGQMLHAVQDFYAHSTWVELKKYDTFVDFGKLTKIPPPDLINLQPATGKVCGPNPAGFPLLTPVSQLTTGYFDHNKILVDPAPEGLCQHGTLLQAESTCLLGAPKTVSGISKDSPCATYPIGPVDAHGKALAAARNETTAFVQSILSDLSGNPTGFCALLGISGNAPICYVGTLSGTLPLQSVGVVIPTNNVSFGVAIDVNGAVSPAIVPISFHGTTVDNWFVTDCPPTQNGNATGNACVPFGKTYDWLLEPTLCVGDGKNSCGPKGSATLKLLFYLGGIGADSSDTCDITINLTTVAGIVQASAVQGSVCNYVSFNTVLPADKALCFNAPAGQVCP